MVDIIEAYVLAAQRLHVDETPVPVPAKGKRRQSDCGPRSATIASSAVPIHRPPATSTLTIAAVCIPKRLCELSGVMRADVYAGFNMLDEPGPLPGTIVEVGC